MTYAQLLVEAARGVKAERFDVESHTNDGRAFTSWRNANAWFVEIADSKGLGVGETRQDVINIATAAIDDGLEHEVVSIAPEEIQ